MTLDEMALAVACAFSVDDESNDKPAYAVRALAECFPAFTVQPSPYGPEGVRTVIVTDAATGEHRVVWGGYGRNMSGVYVGELDFKDRVTTPPADD